MHQSINKENQSDRVNTLLAGYPKSRPLLSQAHQDIYAKEYLCNRTGGGIANKLAVALETWMHRRIAQKASQGKILEIGAGTLNHVPYEHNYIAYDVIEPFLELHADSPNKSFIGNCYQSFEDIPDYNRYDRVISIAVLEHLTDLPVDLAKAALRLNNSGIFQAGVPSEGSLLWWLAWRFGTGLSYFLRTGLNYAELMRHEHVNNVKEIVSLIQELFREVYVSRFPTLFLHGSLYTYIEARHPNVDLCRSIVAVRFSS